MYKICAYQAYISPVFNVIILLNAVKNRFISLGAHFLQNFTASKIIRRYKAKSGHFIIRFA
jgi:hypothetical protein